MLEGDVAELAGPTLKKPRQRDWAQGAEDPEAGQCALLH
jgi:hypothetical protein